MTDTPTPLSTRDRAMKYALAMHANRDYKVSELVRDAKVIEGYLDGPASGTASTSGITFDKDGKQITGPTVAPPASASTGMPVSH